MMARASTRSNALLAIATAALLTACATSGPEGNGSPGSTHTQGMSRIPAAGEIDVVNASRLVAKRPVDVAGIVRRFDELRPEIDRRIRVNDADLLLAAPVGRTYRQQEFHKALAIASPAETCPHYEVVTGADSPRAAVEQVLSQCVATVDGLNEARGTDCACEVVAIDTALLVEPETLPYRDRLQAHLVLQDKGGEPLNRQVLLAETAGSDDRQELTLRSARGREVCSGTIQTTRPGMGRIDLRCPSLGGGLEGDYRIVGHRDGRDFGTALLGGGAGRAALFLGYSEQEYLEARSEVLSRLVAAR